MYYQRNAPKWRRYATAGTEFSLTFILMLLGGLWFDLHWRPTLPAYMLICGTFGFAGALYRLVRQAKEIHRQGLRDYEDQKQRNPREPKT